MATKEINIELDGKKLWPLLEYAPGELVGVALLTNEELASGDGQPSMVFRAEIADGTDAPLTVLVDVKLATLIMILSAARGRLEHLASIRQMVTSIGGRS